MGLALQLPKPHAGKEGSSEASVLAWAAAPPPFDTIDCAVSHLCVSVSLACCSGLHEGGALSTHSLSTQIRAVT